MAVEYEIASDIAVISEVANTNQLAHVAKFYTGAVTYDDEASSKFATVTIDGKSQRVMLCIAVNGTVNYDDVPCKYSTVDGHRCLNVVEPTGTEIVDDVPSVYETMIVDGKTVRAIRCVLINQTPIYDGVSSVCTFVDSGKTHTAQLVNVVGAGSIEVIVKGVPPLALPDAVDANIPSLIAFGGTDMSATPTPTTPANIVCNNGAIKVKDSELPVGYRRVLGYECDNNVRWQITDFHLRGSDTVRISFSIDAACNVFGCYQGQNANDNYDLYASTSSGAKYLRYGNGTYLSYFSSANLGQRFDVVFSPTGTTGMPQDSTWTPMTFEAENDFLVGATTLTGSSSKLKGNLYGNIIVDGRLKLIPCERVSDGVLGYFDTYSQTFYEPQGTATSLGYDDSYIAETYIDGTTETISVHGLEAGYIPLDSVSISTAGPILNTGINALNTKVEVIVKRAGSAYRGLCTYSADYLGCYVVAYNDAWGVSSSNTITSINAAEKHKLTIVFDKPTYNRATLTINGNSVSFTRTNSRNDAVLKFFGAVGSTAQAFIGTCWGIKMYSTTDDSLLFDAVPCMRASDSAVGFYDKVSSTFIANSGTGEFVAGTPIVGTATAQPLLAIDDYKDEQDIITGKITRRIRVRVLKGTEDWISNTTNLYLFGPGDALKPTESPQRIAIPCTHFVGTNAANASMPNNSIKQGNFTSYTNNGGIGIKMTSVGNVTAFKQWLAGQYAAGTPVIIAYVLKTPVTEHVAAQHLGTVAGDNSAEITQASLNGLELQVTYMAGVQVTVEEVENAQLSPDVEVTIQ